MCYRMTNTIALNIWIGLLIIAVLYYGINLGRKNKLYNLSPALIFLWLIYLKFIDTSIINNYGFIYGLPVVIFFIPWIIIKLTGKSR